LGAFGQVLGTVCVRDKVARPTEKIRAVQTTALDRNGVLGDARPRGNTGARFVGLSDPFAYAVKEACHAAGAKPNVHPIKGEPEIL